MSSATAAAILEIVLLGCRSTPLVRMYQEETFFDRWTYAGTYNNTTHGDAIFVNKSVVTTSLQLTYVTSNRIPIIRDGNSSTVGYNYKRDTVRITSDDSYRIGSIWGLNAVHFSNGCSVWPAFWGYGKGVTWLQNGEIDTFEHVNMGFSNQMALHTEDEQCPITASSSTFSRIVNSTSCYYKGDVNSECATTDTNYDSSESTFSVAGGGIFVIQLSDVGISTWFFKRSDIPGAINNADSEIDTNNLGTPSVFYALDGCNISEYFGD
nr:endo-1,3(4)-beta-glucanase [Cryptococcus depauperatus CBS 7855]